MKYIAQVKCECEFFCKQIGSGPRCKDTSAYDTCNSCQVWGPGQKLLQLRLTFMRNVNSLSFVSWGIEFYDASFICFYFLCIWSGMFVAKTASANLRIIIKSLDYSDETSSHLCSRCSFCICLDNIISIDYRYYL